MLQRAFDTAAEDMGLRAPTIVTPYRLKLVLALGFRMKIRDDLTTGLHPFVLGQHTATVQKFLRGQADRYTMVASGAGATSLEDTEILLAPDDVTLLRNFSMARGQWLRTRLIVRTCLGVDHNASEGLGEFGKEMLARETDLEEYLPRNSALLPQIPTLLHRHTQIRWSNWLASQWGKTSGVPFPDLAGLWTAMENQEPWDPTFPAGYTLTPEAAYGGGMSTRQTPGPTHPAQWPTSETSATPAVAAAATVAPTLKAETARRSGGQVVRGNPGLGGGGIGGGGAGDEERLNSMAYNNTYMEGRWGLLCQAGAMRIITCKASLAGVNLPAFPVDPKCKACPTFNIKGMCNTGCGNATDHVTHIREQDLPLWVWAVRAIPEIADPSASVT